MAVLTNSKHEQFAQAIAKGVSATKAYVSVGYSEKGAQQSSARMLLNAVVCSRIAELQQTLAAGMIALEISSRNARVQALQDRWDRMRRVIDERAGAAEFAGLAEMAGRGIITLQVGIHGIPVTMEQSVYDSLGAGALANYNTFGLDNRDRYYYWRVYLGCIRANDFLTSHPKWDGVTLVVTGGSQGGALSIVTAALDPRVRGLAAYYPALSDVTGYLHNRAGGWPHMFRAADGPLSNRSLDKIETSRYYDVVNFARRVKVPGLYSWGFNDETCPPTSMYSAYNVIPGPKKLLLALETGHNNIPEQVAEVQAWLQAFLQTASAGK